MLPGLGDARLRELLRRYGSAGAALSAPAAELGVEAAALRGSRKVSGRVARALESLERLEVAMLLESDARYPALLRHLHDPPYLLYARGRLELLERPAVAVVGARRHTAYGAEATRLLAADLARAGVVVVSGMARGIDALAHEAALAGGTIGVLGNGIDVAYPVQNTRLYERIAAQGLLLSEFEPGEPALPHHFPRRNRLIAALARGVVVVEASTKSGSLITAGHALDIGREVFAVPGPIGRDTSAGTNALIRDGARLVTCAADILEELGLPVPAEPPPSGVAAAPPVAVSPDGLRVWRALAEEARHVDEVAAASGLSAPGTLAGLLELELAGLARQHPGMRYARAQPRA
ncbi:MAG: DNA-protecting protein DprA [Gemmatimonadetes bacterium]|nr:DNA-protecting protein DprA [Gemmatimonadota bacterium]